MATTLQQLRAGRRKYYMLLLASMKVLDGFQEKLQRQIRLCLSRKKGFIDVKDWTKSKEIYDNVVKSVNNFGSLLAKSFIE